MKSDERLSAEVNLIMSSSNVNDDWDGESSDSSLLESTDERQGLITPVGRIHDGASINSDRPLPTPPDRLVNSGLSSELNICLW